MTPDKPTLQGPDLAKSKLILSSYVPISGLIFNDLNYVVNEGFISPNNLIPIDLKRGTQGITHRNLELSIKSAPPLAELLSDDTTYNRVIILGNGLSTLAIKLAQMYKNGQIKERPVIVDAFNYEDLLTDLLELQSRYAVENLPFPFAGYLVDAQAIVNEIRGGNLSTTSYLVGSGELAAHPELSNASLVINIFGPPKIEEQLEMLDINGKLIIISEFKPTSEYSVESFVSQDQFSNAGSVITKIA